mgnify:CR=1 FL=1
MRTVDPNTGPLVPDRNLIDVLSQSNKYEYDVNPLIQMNIENDYFDTSNLANKCKSSSIGNYKYKMLHINIHSLPDKFD